MTCWNLKFSVKNWCCALFCFGVHFVATMPTKQLGKRKGSSSLRAPPYDDTRFVSKKAQDYYAELCTNSPIAEFGIDLWLPCFAPIANQMALRQWLKFAQQLEPAAINIVIEFYANMLNLQTPYQS